MNNMTAMINRLSDIEEAAVHLEGMAAKQKEEIDAEYEKKTIEFDERIDARTDRKLEQLAEKLNDEAEAELRRMRHEMEAELSEMEQEYAQNHKKIAAEIVRKMTED